MDEERTERISNVSVGMHFLLIYLMCAVAMAILSTILSHPMPETAIGRIGYYLGGAAPVFLIAVVVFLVVRIFAKGVVPQAAAWGAAIFVIALMAVSQF